MPAAYRQSRGETLDQRNALPAPLLATWTAIALCGFVPLLALSLTGEGGNESWIGALNATLIAGARFSWIIGSSRRRLFEMTAWLFIYAFLGLAPLVQLRDQVDPETTRNLSHQFDLTAVSIVVAFELALMVGSTLAARTDSRQVKSIGRVVAPQRAVAVLTVMIVAAGGYIAIVGVQRLLFLSRNDRDAAIANIIADDTIRPLIGAFVSMGLLVAIVAQLQAQRLRHAEGKRRSFFLPFIGILLLLTIVNPVSTARFVMLTVVIGLLAAWGVFRSIKVYRALSLVALAAMFLIFPVLDLFRNSLDNVTAESDPLVSLRGGDFDSFAQIINTVTYVNEHGITWGNQLLGVVLFFVPRSLWPAKPTDTGILLAEYKGYWFTNLSAPMPAELYINGSWLLLIIGAIVLGYWLRNWDRASDLHIQRYGVPTILGCILPAYFVLVMRGSLLQAMANLAVILALWLFVTRRQVAEDQTNAASLPAMRDAQ